MVINGIYINPNNVFSAEIIEIITGEGQYIVNIDKELILDRGFIIDVNNDNKIDIVEETYYIMRDIIIKDMCEYEGKSSTIYYQFNDVQLKESSLQYIRNEYNYIHYEPYNRVPYGGLPEIVSKHFTKAFQEIMHKYELKHISASSIKYILRIQSTTNTIEILIDSQNCNEHNPKDFFRELKRTVDLDELKKHWYSKFEKSIQI